MKTADVRNILVPIDFSKMSIGAIDSAKRIAHRFGAMVHLANVHSWNYPADFMEPILSTAGEPVTFEKRERETLLQKLKSLALKSGVSAAATHLIEGSPAFHEICRLAEEIAADLIVMPTHGHTGLKHVFIGSTAERVVQHSPCPVFVSREDTEASKGRFVSSVNTILVPVDFSQCSLDGLTYAISFANRTGSKLIVLHAVYPGYIYSNSGLALYDVSALEKAAFENAGKQMRKLVRSVKFGEVKFETAITMGLPMPEICRFAQQHKIDLIVTSTHGWTGFNHLTIGSTAEQVVRHAHCSVLVVPSHPKLRSASLSRRSGRRPKTRTLERKMELSLHD